MLQINSTFNACECLQTAAKTVFVKEPNQLLKTLQGKFSFTYLIIDKEQRRIYLLLANEGNLFSF